MKNIFHATIEIIGVNPYVEVPDSVLTMLQKSSQKKSGPFPVKGYLEGKPYKQTVVKFQGVWRLYLNTPMRMDTNTRVGDTVTVEIEYDFEPRIVPVPPLLLDALKKNKRANEAFQSLPPYRQKEISRYISMLKSQAAVQQNIDKVIQYLKGEAVEGVLFRNNRK